MTTVADILSYCNPETEVELYTGEIYPVQVENLEGNNASSSSEALNFVSVTEDLYDLQKESGNDSDSAAGEHESTKLYIIVYSQQLFLF